MFMVLNQVIPMSTEKYFIEGKGRNTLSSKTIHVYSLKHKRNTSSVHVLSKWTTYTWQWNIRTQRGHPVWYNLYLMLIQRLVFCKDETVHVSISIFAYFRSACLEWVSHRHPHSLHAIILQITLGCINLAPGDVPWLPMDGQSLGPNQRQHRVKNLQMFGPTFDCYVNLK